MAPGQYIVGRFREAGAKTKRFEVLASSHYSMAFFTIWKEDEDWNIKELDKKELYQYVGCNATPLLESILKE